MHASIMAQIAIATVNVARTLSIIIAECLGIPPSLTILQPFFVPVA